MLTDRLWLESRIFAMTRRIRHVPTIHAAVIVKSYIKGEHVKWLSRPGQTYHMSLPSSLHNRSSLAVLVHSC